jgi:hypothetical protein
VDSTWEIFTFLFLNCGTNEWVATKLWLNLWNTGTLAETRTTNFAAITPACPWLPNSINWAWVHIAVKALGEISLAIFTTMSCFNLNITSTRCLASTASL